MGHGACRPRPGCPAWPQAGRSRVLWPGLSCPSPGNCGAGGYYQLNRKFPHNSSKAFAVSERNGVWGRATELRGNAVLSHIACTRAGDCLAIGIYTGKKGIDPFAVTEKHFRWGRVRTFTRLIARNTGRYAALTSVSCESSGNCTTVGFYNTTRDQDVNSDVIFAFSQKHGRWGPIIALHGIAAPPPGYIEGSIGSLSCPSPGQCTAGGDDGNGDDPELSQPYVVTEKNGVWGRAGLIPGVAALSASSMIAGLTGVACRSPGDCGAAGVYDSNSGGETEVFVATERNGVWGNAAELPGIAALNTANLVGVSAISCGSPRDCALGGYYFAAVLNAAPYLATQKNGTWGEAHRVRGITP